MVFKKGRFMGSTLKILGNMGLTKGEWAIAGGTGHFAFAQGVVSYKEFNHLGDLFVRELDVHAIYTPIREVFSQINFPLLINSLVNLHSQCN
uniref:Dirigent protein n=1 Tax=Leersia perrieri TaxID=77586 RepID=A0A0D9XZE3_9ORYZ